MSPQPDTEEFGSIYDIPARHPECQRALELEQIRIDMRWIWLQQATIRLGEHAREIRARIHQPVCDLAECRHCHPRTEYVPRCELNGGAR